MKKIKEELKGKYRWMEELYVGALGLLWWQIMIC